ncbi:hypothetical protein BJ912DRAFT_861771 [Pholiota molesta]|nr:hypothetical protein BJ912DRAFT_861771 [Pholiota molesta]
MSLLGTVVGFSFVGLAARLGQLSIKSRNLYSNPGGHLISMGAFGMVGYYAYQWETYSNDALARKAKEIEERRIRAIAKADEAAAAATDRT